MPWGHRVFLPTYHWPGRFLPGFFCLLLHSSSGSGVCNYKYNQGGIMSIFQSFRVKEWFRKRANFFIVLLITILTALQMLCCLIMAVFILNYLQIIDCSFMQSVDLVRTAAAALCLASLFWGIFLFDLIGVTCISPWSRKSTQYYRRLSVVVSFMCISVSCFLGMNLNPLSRAEFLPGCSPSECFNSKYIMVTGGSSVCFKWVVMIFVLSCLTSIFSYLFLPKSWLIDVIKGQ